MQRYAPPTVASWYGRKPTEVLLRRQASNNAGARQAWHRWTAAGPFCGSAATVAVLMQTLTLKLTLTHAMLAEAEADTDNDADAEAEADTEADAGAKAGVEAEADAGTSCDRAWAAT